MMIFRTFFFNNNKQDQEIEKKIGSLLLRISLLGLSLFDDRAMRQSDFDLAEDCVMIEFITKKLLNKDIIGIQWFNQEAIKNAVPTDIEESIYGRK